MNQTVWNTAAVSGARMRARLAALAVAEIIGVAALLFLASQMRFYLPFTPVPVTLQTFVVMLLPFCFSF